MSERHKANPQDITGDKNPMYGLHHTPESIEKISKALKGRERSKETAEKLSLSNSDY